MGLRQQLAGRIPPPVIHHLSDHFCIVGEIAVIALPEDLRTYGPVVAEAILSRQHAVRTVLNKVSRLEGPGRTFHFEVLAGGGTVTIQKEYGFTYHLDLATVFFNPRMATERKRVTDQVHAGETVLVPFCGAGPFVIPAGARGAEVVAIEQNPFACRWLERNIESNGVRDRVVVIRGDAFDTSLLLGKIFDRAIIPAPYGRDAVLEILSPCVKAGGTIHFYTFQGRQEAEVTGGIFRRCNLCCLRKRPCGNVAPGIRRWVYDLRKNDPAHPPSNLQGCSDPSR